MRKSPEMTALETRFGKPLPALLAETYDREGSIRAAAVALGVNHRTLFGWMQRFGVRITRSAQVA